MNVDELFEYAQWLGESISQTRPQYDTVRGLFQHNASQPNKEPVEPALDKLKELVLEVPLHQLSNEQMKLLDAYDVASYFGQAGVRTIAAIVQKSSFDPATAAGELQEIVKALDNAQERAGALTRAFEEISDWTAFEREEGRVEIRLEFQDRAAISNMVEWKNWAARWHDIARGVAMVAGEAPENVHVVGASKGSIILILATTYTVALLLGGIFKIVTRRASEVVQLGVEVENLRTRRLLNNELEQAFKRRAQEIKSGGVEEAIAEVKKLHDGTKDGEIDNALSKSVKELFDFCEKGGDLDFVAPQEDDAQNDEDEVDEPKRLVAEMRELIKEIKSNKETLKQLTFQRPDDEDADDS